MTLTRRPSPFSELVTLRQAMDRLFDDPSSAPVTGATGNEGGNLALDVRTTKDALLVEAALPGVTPEDVDITIENGTLAIRAETEPSGATPTATAAGSSARSAGAVVRTVTLPTASRPTGQATFENGVLSLRIPKAEQVKPRQIRISPVRTARPRRRRACQRHRPNQRPSPPMPRPDPRRHDDVPPATAILAARLCDQRRGDPRLRASADPPHLRRRGSHLSGANADQHPPLLRG